MSYETATAGSLVPRRLNSNFCETWKGFKMDLVKGFQKHWMKIGKKIGVHKCRQGHENYDCGIAGPRLVA